MEICITIGGKRHCFWIPIYLYPIKIVKGPGPVNYQALISDATVVGTVREAAKNVEDREVRAALENGVNNAVKAMQGRAGEGVTVSLGSASQ